jgi:ABC-type Fe3+/spermidine/putrescine transport system ATPase subunit
MIASYPRYDPELSGLVILQDQISQCWETSMDRFLLLYDAPELVALEAYVRNRARGEITSLHKRLRLCFISFRAEANEPGSEVFKLLELYLMYRGNGLKIETPAVRC